MKLTSGSTHDIQDVVRISLYTHRLELATIGLMVNLHIICGLYAYRNKQ